MKEGAPKRQKKKSAGEGAEFEYTPLRRHKSKSPGAVVLSVDEISVSYDRDAEVSASSLTNEDTLPNLDTGAQGDPISPSTEQPPIDAQMQEEASAPTDAPRGDLADDVPLQDELAQEGTEEQDDSYTVVEEPEGAPEGVPGEQEPSLVAADNEQALPYEPQLERVILPDEISLVGVLPLEENNEHTPTEAEAQEPSVQTEEQSPVKSDEDACEQTDENAEAAMDDDEEFVFTPMPTPVVYERVVLPDEISLVDVFPEFNIPVVQENTEAEASAESEQGEDTDATASSFENESRQEGVDSACAEEPEIDDTQATADEATDALDDESAPAQLLEEDSSLSENTPVDLSPVQSEEESNEAADFSVDMTENATDAIDAEGATPCETTDTRSDESDADPLAAEFDFSDIDFDTPVQLPTIQNESEDPEKASESDEADSPPEPLHEDDGIATPEQSAEDAPLLPPDEQTEAVPSTEDESVLAPEEITDAENEQTDVSSDTEGGTPDRESEDESAYFPDAPKKKKEKASSEEQRPIENRFDIVELFAFTLALVFIVTAFFFRSSTVKGSSMEATLHDGDQLILYSFLYEPEIGDIIVFEDYSTPYREPLVKRVIATEGQTVTILDSYTVLVDGVMLPQDYVYVDKPDDTHYPIQYEVSEGHLFVMGDHRNASSDSRAFGEVSKSAVLGKVILRYYPFEDFKYFSDEGR